MFFLPISRESRAYSRPLSQHPSHLPQDSLARFFGADNNAPRSPALDVAESDSAYIATLEMPGVAKENIRVSVEGRVVTVQAQEQSAEPSAATQTSAGAAPAAETATATENTAEQAAERTAERTAERVVYRERSAARYARRFSLPVEVEQGATVAKLDQGVLTLTLPKRSARNAATVTVN